MRRDYPLIEGHSSSLIYFDSAATMQKPQVVLDRMTHFYQHENANIHRGVYSLSEQATINYDNARNIVAKFLNVKNSAQIIFTKGATESVNLLAHSYLRPLLKAGDEVIVTHMEHHANFVPWQMLCQSVGARLRVVEINDAGELKLDHYRSLLNKKTRLVAVTHASNVLGTINPVEQLVSLAHQQNIPILIDGAQAVPHFKVDLTALNCDFYLFSGHKLGGPLGIGALYLHEKWLDQLEPYQYGGDMTAEVSLERSTFQQVPAKFEAGTQNIVGALGLATAIQYLEGMGFEEIERTESKLKEYFLSHLSKLSQVRLIGEARARLPIFAMTLGRIHPHDLATLYAKEGIAVRAGHHCAMPLMKRFNVPATLRASLAHYNTETEIDRFFDVTNEIQEYFKRHGI